MAEITPSFNGYTLTSANFQTDRIQDETPHDERPRGSVFPETAAVPEGTRSGRRITISGMINSATNLLARTDLRTLMNNLRGADRTKKGKLDLYGNGHFYAQLTGRPKNSVAEGEGKINVELEFFAEDPYRRNNTLTTVTKTPTGGDPTIDITFGSSQDFGGDAPRIPLVINMGGSWTAGDLIRIYSTTAGWRFEKTVVNTLTASQDLIIMGDVSQVDEGTQRVNEGINGTDFPYLKGGVSNELDFTGTTTLGVARTFEWWDRFLE